MEVGKKSENLPPGFRFHPTDEELITYYLMNKILDPNFTGKAITDVDLNRSEPWDLPGKAKMGEKEWYFYSLRDRKYPTGVRTNRATSAGYWKTTGKDKEILNSRTLEPVGMKKTLVFYKGRAPRGEKTSWVIHEYRHLPKSTEFKNCKDEWVVCRVFEKTSTGKKCFSNHPRPNLSPTSSSSSMAAPTTNHLHDGPYQHGFHGRNDVYPSTVMMLVDNDNHPLQLPTTICGVRQLQGFTFPVSGAPFVVQPPPVDQGGGGLIQSMEQCVELDAAFWPALLS